MKMYAYVFFYIYVSALTFRSLLHPEVNFCIWYKLGVHHHSLHVDIQFSLVLFTEKTVLSLLTMSFILIENQLIINVGDLGAS